MSKIAIITSWDAKYQPIADVTVPILRAYADRWGYTLHTGTYTADPENLRDYGDRGKIDLFMQVYDTHSAVMFLDIDAIVMNHDIKIEDVCNGRYFTWSYDPSGPCSGFWIARCVPEVRNALLVVQRLAQERGKITVRENLGPPHNVVLQMEPHGASDQDVMTQLLGVPPFSLVFGYEGHLRPAKEVGHCYHNARYHGWEGLEDQVQYEPGDWIVTAPSYPFEERLAILKSYAETIYSSARVERLETHPESEKFDRNWCGPEELKPRVYRTQSEKDTWHACVVDNEYRLPRKLNEWDIVIDIGAHIGSLSYAAHVSGSRHIYAFEIDPWHMDAAQENLKPWLDDSIALHHAAVVRGDGYRSKTYRYNGAWNSFGVVGAEVPSISLDQIIEDACPNGERVRFLKIDCEGGEWPILYTCTKLDHVDEIAGEYHTSIDRSATELQNLPGKIGAFHLSEFLEKHGFRVEIAGREEIGNFWAKRVGKAGGQSGS
jgi:FkbM family methyltransferase